MSVGRRLLLVTSDVEVGRALAEAFGDAFAVTACPSAEEALAHLAARYYPLVLADYALPGRDGAWLLGEVRRLSSSTRRVLLSATAVPDLFELRAEGVVEVFLPKPFDPEEFRAYVTAPPARR
ncbi:MAG TPA: response regulator [Polyangiaceae bacterium]|nr:response regulator [Polyangiaceae bacterium]